MISRSWQVRGRIVVCAQRPSSIGRDPQRGSAGCFEQGVATSALLQPSWTISAPLQGERSAAIAGARPAGRDRRGNAQGRSTQSSDGVLKRVDTEMRSRRENVNDAVGGRRAHLAHCRASRTENTSPLSTIDSRHFGGVPNSGSIQESGGRERSLPRPRSKPHHMTGFSMMARPDRGVARCRGPRTLPRQVMFSSLRIGPLRMNPPADLRG